MKLTQEQLNDLKKIDYSFKEIQFYAERNGIQIEDLYTLFSFPIFDYAQAKKMELLNHTTNRQRVFEQSQAARASRSSDNISL
ncbi:hypothetical protein BH11BAC2_BH11BAC2_03860 [soil metagenome]